MNKERVILAGMGTALFLLMSSAFALGPHEVLLLANGNSEESVKIATHYAKLRNIPSANIIMLDLPEDLGQKGVAIKPDEFEKHIWTPANEMAAERGISDHILAWVYSPPFPTRITGEEVTSIQGITFLRNRSEAGLNVKRALYRSSLFAGPDNPKNPGHFAQSFDVHAEWLGSEMPLPSMMLGQLGMRGNSVEEILASLERGLKSDASRPIGSVYYVISSDIRSKCRAWQFKMARHELGQLGINAIITNTVPAKQADIMGIMMGAADVVPRQYGSYLPGCISENLTSAAASFHTANQTKISEWIKAGATATAGAVTEPYSLWQKFPNARIFAFQAQGCTIIESFYQSLRCPLQLLIIGDPLAAPWKEPFSLRLKGLPVEVIAGKVQLNAMVLAKDDVLVARFVFMVDGQIVQDCVMDGCELDTTALANGKHRLRVVGYATGLVRTQSFTEQPFVVKNVPPLGEE